MKSEQKLDRKYKIMISGLEFQVSRNKKRYWTSCSIVNKEEFIVNITAGLTKRECVDKLYKTIKNLVVKNFYHKK